VGEGDQVRQYQTGVRRSRGSDRRWGHRVVSLWRQCLNAIGGEADVGRPSRPCRSEAIDPQATAAKIEIPRRSGAVLSFRSQAWEGPAVNRRAFITLLGGASSSPLAARTMRSKSQCVLLVLVFLLTTWGFGLELKAQSPTYRPINSADLLGGYILDGEWIETTGHVWVSDKGVFFNLNLPSARAPMPVDVANVDPENIRRLKSTCGAPDQFSGGCQVTMRGQVGRLDTRHQGILARDIQIIPTR
jgi:hypothetical protein